VGVEFFYVYRQTDGQKDGQTDMTKLIVIFRSFANSCKSSLCILFTQHKLRLMNVNVTFYGLKFMKEVDITNTCYEHLPLES
jgi:hypothetical protein